MSRVGPLASRRTRGCRVATSAQGTVSIAAPRVPRTRGDPRGIYTVNCVPRIGISRIGTACPGSRVPRPSFGPCGSVVSRHRACPARIARGPKEARGTRLFAARRFAAASCARARDPASRPHGILHGCTGCHGMSRDVTGSYTAGSYSAAWGCTGCHTRTRYAQHHAVHPSYTGDAGSSVTTTRPGQARSPQPAAVWGTEPALPGPARAPDLGLRPGQVRV